jgi:hypothetical protein
MLETLTDAEMEKPRWESITEAAMENARWESVMEAATAVAALILRRLYDETDVRRALSHALTIATFAIDHKEGLS